MHVCEGDQVFCPPRIIYALCEEMSAEEAVGSVALQGLLDPFANE